MDAAANKTAVELNSTLVNKIVYNLYATTNSSTCTYKAAVNTFDTKHSQIFVNRTDAQVTGNYSLTYDNREQGRGQLNQFGLDKLNLTDVHLVKRFAEACAMTYCTNDTARQNVLDKNLRNGNFSIVLFTNDY